MLDDGFSARVLAGARLDILSSSVIASRILLLDDGTRDDSRAPRNTTSHEISKAGAIDLDRAKAILHGIKIALSALLSSGGCR